MSRLRRPGSPWRILVHDYVGGDPCYGKAHHVTNDRSYGRLPRSRELRQRVEETELIAKQAGISETILLAGTEFDELVIGSWIHLEQMSASQWWLNVGGVTVWVTADRDGRPKQVQVYGPSDYDEPVDGCTYSCKWEGIRHEP